MVNAQKVMRPGRVRPLWLALGLSGVAAVLVVLGALFAIAAGHAAPPALVPAPPGAHRLWASQTTDMLQGNQVLSVALYRVPGTPGNAIAFYRRGDGGRPGALGRFETVVRSGSAAALPFALQHLPSAFADGTGDAARADYTYTEYHAANSDVGIAVDLRHPHGPTLVFVEMLSQ